MEKDKILARSLKEKLAETLREIDNNIYRMVDIIIEKNKDKKYIPFEENPANSVDSGVPMYMRYPLCFVHIIGLTSDGCLVSNYDRNKRRFEDPAVIARRFANNDWRVKFFKHSLDDPGLMFDFLDVNHSMLLNQLIDFAMKGEKSGK